MNTGIDYRVDQASLDQICEHLQACEASFVPSLAARVDIREYSGKICTQAKRFEAWTGGVLTGLVAMYCNDSGGALAYITSVSVLPGLQGRGIASRLISNGIKHASGAGFARIGLAVHRDSEAVIALYRKHGFLAVDSQGEMVNMALKLA